MMMRARALHQWHHARARPPSPPLDPPPLVARKPSSAPSSSLPCPIDPQCASRQRRSLRCSASSSGREQQQPASQQQLPSYADVAAAAARRGLRLERSVAGPFYRIDLYEGEERARRRAERRAERERERRAKRRRAAGLEEEEAATTAATTPARPPPLPPQPELLATTDGFVVPPPLGGYAHCDTLRIPQRATLGEEEDGEEKQKGDKKNKDDAGGALGLMPLIGCAVLAHARERGCAKAEILAIDDDEQQHRRLVSYYRYFGFKPLHRVGGRGFFVDLPHLLVWGGEGLRMELEVEEALGRWGRALRRQEEEQEEERAGGGDAAPS